MVSEGPSVRAVPDAEQLPVGVMVEEVDVLVWRVPIGDMLWVVVQTVSRFPFDGGVRWRLRLTFAVVV